MHRRFGLTRDPFQAVYDAELYWESRERRELRRQAANSLAAGNNLWVRGPVGSGRVAFAQHLFSELTAAATPAIIASGPLPESGPELVGLLSEQLLTHASPPDPADPLAKVEALYAALVELWSNVGTLPLLVAQGQVGVGAMEELRIFCELKLFGHPLVSVVLIGEGEPPMQCGERVEELALPAYSAEELGRLIRHRLLMCGGPDALPASTIEQLCVAPAGSTGPVGVGQVLTAARAALARRALEPQTPTAQAKPVTSDSSVFSSDDIGAVSDLLAAISSEFDPSKE